jgi:hypothetical protein
MIDTSQCHADKILIIYFSTVERQRRYIERWGLRGANRETKEKNMLKKLEAFGILPSNTKIRSIRELLKQMAVWEESIITVQVTPNPPEDHNAANLTSESGRSSVEVLAMHVDSDL